MKSIQEMQREVVAFAMEEMRNRGLEEAAVICEQQRAFSVAHFIRQRKRDPAAKMTDWWGPQYVADFAPIGA